MEGAGGSSRPGSRSPVPGKGRFQPGPGFTVDRKWQGHRRTESLGSGTAGLRGEGQGEQVSSKGGKVTFCKRNSNLYKLLHSFQTRG